MIFNYNKSGEIHTLGQCGRLNCINTWWVLPGDTVDIDFGGLYRMPNMRKYMWTPVDVRMYMFFTPAAWVFPQFRDRLRTYMRDPFNATASNTASLAFSGNTPFSFSNDDHLYYHWLDGSPKSDKLFPSSIATYYRVWNEWFRDLNHHNERRTDIGTSGFNSYYTNSFNNASDPFKNYGHPVCNLPNIFSNFNERSDDVEAEYKTDITADQLDLVALQQQAQSIKSVQEYVNIAQRYRDMLEDKYGGSVSHEADPRPYLLASSENEFGGHDIDATGTNIGETQAKSTGKLQISLKNTMFGEHGFLQLYMVPRFRPIYEESHNPIFHFMQDHPEEMLALPEYISQSEPMDIGLNDFFNDSFQARIAKLPSGEIHRWGYSYAHRRFHEVEAGFPLLKKPTTIGELVECDPDSWNRMFVSQALGNYSVQSQYSMRVKSVLPPSTASMMAGTNLGA